jgi:diguanylate cyclase (GGDEF)-like protein
MAILKTGLTRSVLSNKYLRHEILIAFCLIILTLLVFLGYLFPGVSASSLFSNRATLPFVIAILAIILNIGFLIIWQIVEPVIRLSREAKMIAAGDLNREIRLVREDELGELGSSVNALTRRIRENVEELNSLNKKTEILNDEINNRIVMLSNLMEISNGIAQKVALKDILRIAVTKCFPEQEMSFGCVILKDASSGDYKLQYLHSAHEDQLNARGIAALKINLGIGVLGKAILKQEAIIVDQRSKMNQDIEDFKRLFMVNNAIVAPISSTGNAYGLIIAGNDRPHYVCTDIQKDLLQLVSKHIAIAVLNERLSQEIEKFEVTDSLTGLYNNAYARSRLGFEVKQAVNTQKTCSFVLIKIDHFQAYLEMFGHIGAEDALLKIAEVLKEHLHPEAKASRFAEHEFAIVIPSINKRETIILAERIVAKIAEKFAAQENKSRRLTVTAAVVENPLDGRTADELILKSGIILADTIEQGGNRVGFHK